MRFEKWQALGNDYLIVEAADADPGAGPQALRPALRRRRRRRARSSPPDEPGFVARLRIFNPDGSEAELSGNGAREAILYLRRRGWTDADTFSIQTLAGEIRPTITGPTTCRVDMGRAALTRSTSRAARPTAAARSAGFRFQHVAIGNPQCAIRVDGPRRARPARRSARRSSTPPIFPNRTNVSFWTRDRAATRSAPASSSAAWGRRCRSGTGASGAAVAHVVRGGDSPVTVHLDGGELEVDVDESLHVDLTGWAVPVYRGELITKDGDALRGSAARPIGAAPTRP